MPVIRRLQTLLNPSIRATWRRRVKALIAIRWRNFFSPHPLSLAVDNRLIGPGHPVFIIAEIGINHNGSVERAKKLIDAAVGAGADAVKFQKREISVTYQRDIVDHPEFHDQAFQYLIPLLKEFELGEEEYRELAAYARSKGVMFFASAFDEPSVDFLTKLQPPLYKVASADLTNIPLLERLLRERKPLIVSTGMSTLDEVDETVAFLHRRRAIFALLHCQSTYPASPDTLNLAMMARLRWRYGVPVGYSGHELGYHHTVAAVALGAMIVERHLTLDRRLPGPDHAASLEPDEFKEMVQAIRDCKIARGTSVKRISRGEVANRFALRKSLVAVSDIPAGVTITRTMVAAKSPGTGLSPQRIYDLVGRRALRAIRRDEQFSEADISSTWEKRRELASFASKWGIKARFFELEKLAGFEPRPQLFEFHVSEQDLDFPFDLAKKYTQELCIHAPEYFGREVVDLAAEDDTLWRKSIAVIQRTIDQARAIAPCFAGTPKIIIHVGGMSIAPVKDKARLVSRAVEAFRELDAQGVELLPENLPPFGWIFSGSWHCNVFGAAEEMVDFCERVGSSMCLDLSHAWLYCVKSGDDYLEYIRKVAPYTRHLHIADGRGEHKEGLQIHGGDVPFRQAFEVLEAHLPRGREVSWVPEIWQGHLHDYRQFRIALRELAGYTLLKNGLKVGRGV